MTTFSGIGTNSELTGFHARFMLHNVCWHLEGMPFNAGDVPQDMKLINPKAHFG